MTIRSTSLWGNNKMYATRYRDGRVFCMGDAVHRHPPSNGLGSNTSIQDAYNLAWKLALVLRGQAGEGLLDSYDAERVPVGRQIVLRANQSIEEFGPIFQALGLTDTTDPDLMVAAHAGPRRRHAGGGASSGSRSGRRWSSRTTSSTRTASSSGSATRRPRSCPDGTPEPEYTRDRELYYHPTTWPGARLPHCWVGEGGHKVSTHDLAGKGRFTLLTGISGGAWATAAQRVADRPRASSSSRT